MRNNDEIHDRGMIKWAPFKSLKEFDVALKKMFESRELKPKPKLSSDAVDEILYVLSEALHDKKSIQVTFWFDGEYHTLDGEILKVDLQNHVLCLCPNNAKAIAINIGNIIHADII